MVNLRYSKETLYKLFALLCNKCSFTDCKHPVFDIEKNFLCEICHVEGESPTGPRYNPQQSNQERNGYDNLIILCKDHHDEIDKNASKYSVISLKHMKKDHETKCLEPFTISDEHIEKIYKKIEQTQQNIQFGNGNQFSTFTGDITVQQGLSYKETESLVITLLENNFPKLVESAYEKAIQNGKKFAKTFFEKANTELKFEQQKKFTDPDIQFALNNAIELNARKDSEELRNILSSLIIKRIQNDDSDLKKIVYNEAIETIGKLTIDGLKIITLCFILRYAVWNGVFSWGNLDELIKIRLSSFLDFKNTNAEFQHIVYAGCGEMGIGQWNYPSVLQAQYHELEPMIISKSQLNLHRIPGEIISELFSEIDDENFKFNIANEKQLEDYLAKISVEDTVKNSIRAEFRTFKSQAIQNISRKIKEFGMIQKVVKLVDETDLKHLSLTSVGIVIGAMYYERITGEKIDISIWIN